MNGLVQRDVASTRVLCKIAANETDNESTPDVPLFSSIVLPFQEMISAAITFVSSPPNLALGNSQ